jgi:hypothetical protein
MYKVELERVMKDGGFKLIPAQICAADLAVAKVLQGWDGVRMLVLSKHSNDVVGILTPFILI